MIYAYYDKNGILREIINDSNNRQGSNNRLIYAYFENQDFNDASIIFKIGDYTSIQIFTDHIATEPIPYNSEINYKYFKDNTPYRFNVFVVDDTTMSQNGTCKATITLHDNEDETHETQGLLTFNIQDEIVNDEQLFESQWQYLLDRLSAYEFFTKNGIIGRNDYIADYQDAPDTYKENQLVLTPSTRTSVYEPSRQIIGIKLFKVENGKFRPVYSSLDTTDMSYNNQKINNDQNVEITNIKNRLDSLVLDFSEYVKSSDLSQVAFTGNYNDLSNKPTIPTKLSDLPNDEGFITNAVSDLINYYKKNETLTTDEITARLNAIKTIKFEIYASLDAISEPQTNVIYLVGTESPYTEYAYIEGLGFEGIGSTTIDLSNYVQSDNTLNTNNIIVGNGDKKVKDSGLKIISDSLNNNGVPTTHLVQNAIREIHEITTISGDSGIITSTAISPYRLIIDENLVVYRRVSNDTNALTYHGVMLIDSTHFRDYFLTFNGTTYTRTYTENVSHSEFDELVESTPTDIIYDTQTKVVQLTHDGTPIGEGAVVDINGYTPWFDGETLVLSDVEELDANVIVKAKKIAYADLLSLVDNGGLVAGQYYRIIDYITTTTQPNTRSAGHQFDIIVRADSESKLNENAFAIQTDGDIYFANSDLSAWEIKYDIHNDLNKYAWADETNGKGVIFYMKDEYDNEAPYDFKNIQFKRYKATLEDSKYADFDGQYVCLKDGYGNVVPSGYIISDENDFVWRYTFTKIDDSTGESSDATLKVELTETQIETIKNYGSHTLIVAKNNVIKETYREYVGDDLYNVRLQLNNIVFVNNYLIDIQGTEVNDLSLFDCYNNTFGNDCGSNTFGNNCYNNTFGNDCANNTFGNYCDSNTFGNYCGSNTFGNYCYGNTFGNYCYNNTFGNDCGSNTFGNLCSYIEFETRNKYVDLNKNDTGSYSNNVQYVKLEVGMSGTYSSHKVLNLTRGLSYWTIFSNTNTNRVGNIKEIGISQNGDKLVLEGFDSNGGTVSSSESPNIYLQRRLDKPSAEFDSSTNPTGLTAWWNTNFPKMYRGQIVSIKSVYLGKRYYFVVNEKDDTTVTFTPLSLILRSGEGLIADVVMSVDYTITVHLINAYTNQLSEESLNFSFSGMRLY